MIAEKIQAVLDKEKPWFDLARMALTALGFAIGCFVGVKYAVEKHTSIYDLIIRLTPLVAPICFAVFICVRVVITVRRITDVLLPPFADSKRPMWHPIEIFYFVAICFIALSTNGIIFLAAAALSHQ